MIKLSMWHVLMWIKKQWNIYQDRRMYNRIIKELKGK